MMQNFTIPTISADIGRYRKRSDSSSSSGSSPEGRRRQMLVEEVRNMKRRASRMVIKLQVDHLKKIKETKGLNSVEKETQHFVGITSMHGVLRVYRSKSRSFWFWLALFIISVILLLVQSVNVILLYTAHPISSEVSFIITNGLLFPRITICSYNPTRKSHILELNKTGDFSDRILRYMTLANMDAQVLYGTSSEKSLQEDSDALKAYQKNHPNFTIEDFYHTAGFDCEANLKLCIFAGIQFDCCKYSQQVYTTMGVCQSLDLASSPLGWMNEQNEDGIEAGLQIILDAHLEEQFNGTTLEPAPVFANSFENGFRFFVDSPHATAHATSQGISVSPGHRVYAAISASKYSLLSPEEWGNCTSDWPESLKSPIPYSSKNCMIKCKAKFYNERCGCSPAKYNIDREYRACEPLELYRCTRDKVIIRKDGEGEFYWPPCRECNVACQRWEYTAYNSYGNGFSSGALRWLRSINSKWTESHVRTNFLTINVFFHDMTFMEFKQVQASSITQVLSNMGGNMGMWLGMSVITVIEAIMFAIKLCWIGMSRRRREHLAKKKIKQEQQEKEMEEAVKTFRTQMSSEKNRIEHESRPTLAERIRRLTVGSIKGRERKSRVGTAESPGDTPPQETQTPAEQRPTKKDSVIRKISKISNANAEHRDRFMGSYVEKKLNNKGGIANLKSIESESESDQSVLELKIDMNDLEKQLKKNTSCEVQAPVALRPKLRSRTRSCDVQPALAVPADNVHKTSELYNDAPCVAVNDDIISSQHSEEQTK